MRKFIYILFFTPLLMINFGITDPFESINRRLYSFNRGIDNILIMPCTNFYIKVLPKFIENPINNFLKNILDIQNCILYILNFDFSKAKISFIRFFLNSTIGLCGFLDIASKFNFNYTYFDFNLLKHGSYGSYYIFIPFIGPNTLISTSYILISQLFNPYVFMFNDILIYYFLEIINKRSILPFDTDFFHKKMTDGYVFLKDIYIQKNYTIDYLR
jgi:phospholipid-binding lipoprotein MlaA